MLRNKITYKQYDSRWRWWLYPKKGWYLNGSGCGCLSIFHCVLELEKYASKSPTDVMKVVHPYMKQYAIAGDGTKRDGITQALKHFGFSDVFRCRSLPMSELFKRLNQNGPHVGVLLFSGRKGPDGTRWTSGGHYIAYVDYRKKNGRHEFYLKDSGGRNHSGWYSYERSMRGCVIDAWSAKIPGGNSEKKSDTSTTTNEKKHYSGEYPNVTVTETKKVSNGGKIVEKATEYCWAYGTDKKKWTYKTGSPRSAYKSACSKYMSKTKKISLSDCGHFISTCVRASGISKTFRTLEWGDKIPAGMEIVLSGKSIPAGFLQPGDIIRYKKKNKTKSGAYSQHTLMFYSSGKIAEAGRQIRFPVIQKDTKKYNASNVNRSTLQVIRAVTKKTVTRSYLHNGDKGEEVKKLQAYLNWYFGKKVLEVDGGFGNLTKNAVIDFQKQNGLVTDGTVGAKTLAAMKAVTR